MQQKTFFLEKEPGFQQWVQKYQLEKYPDHVILLNRPFCYLYHAILQELISFEEIIRLESPKNYELFTTMHGFLLLKFNKHFNLMSGEKFIEEFVKNFNSRENKLLYEKIFYLSKGISKDDALKITPEKLYMLCQFLDNETVFNAFKNGTLKFKNIKNSTLEDIIKMVNNPEPPSNTTNLCSIL